MRHDHDDHEQDREDLENHGLAGHNLDRHDLDSECRESPGYEPHHHEEHAHGHHDHHGHDHHAHAHAHAHAHHEHGLGHVHVGQSGLRLAFYLNIGIVLVELIGGYLANSLALMGDAGHNAADAFAIGLAWYAHTQAGKPASRKMSFGYQRSGVLVAVVNALSLIAIAVALLWEAYHRILHPEGIAMTPLFITAALGLAFNTYAALGLHGDSDINIRGAFLHMLGDAAASGGVIVGGVIMLLTGWHWVDPVLSVGIAGLIAFGSWGILRQALRILMEGTPPEIDPAEVVAAILAMDEVLEVHDVHLWSLDAAERALSCHVVVDCGRTVGKMRPLLGEISHTLREHFGIGHTTIQLECPHHEHAADACGLPIVESTPPHH